MDATQETYNQIAKDWIEDHKKDTWWMSGADTFISLLPEGSRVLDVGCAGGAKSKYLSEKGLSAVGIDYSEKMIDIARREVSGAEFFVRDMKEVDQSLGEFDGIFVQAALLHVPKKEVSFVLTKLSGILKPGGYLYIAVKEQRPGQAEEEIVTEDDYGYAYSRFFSYFTMEELKTYLNELHMDICHEWSEESGKTRWLQIIGQKK